MVTTYEVALAEKGFLQRQPWGYLIIDEAHRIKNENSQLSKVVRLFNSKGRLLITGTPLQNNLHELWSLLSFLMPKVFGKTSTDFDQVFDFGDDVSDTTRAQMLRRLHSLISPFLIRRLKADVERCFFYLR